MITETQVQVDYHKVYQELNLFVNASHENLERTFHRRQNMLIKQLQQRANQLKEDISKLKKLTSEQTIQGMIIKKKQEMEAQRMKLQTNWRQLTEKLKKLEQQQKKLRNQNSEALFDISNLEMKIQELTNVNCQLQNNLKNIKQEIKKSTFVSLPDKKPYQSPYKYIKIQENINQKQNQKINNEQNITKRLNQIKQIKKVPNQVLIQLLNKRDIKSQLFDLLHS